MEEISLVIPIYLLDEQLGQITRDCLYSLYNQYGELIIVDDGSKLSAGFLRDTANFYIRHNPNLGFTKSVNDGVAVATKEYVCVINNDTLLLEGNLSSLKRDGFSFPLIEGKQEPKWDGAFFMFPKKIWKGDDLAFKNYFGDLDRFYQARKDGIKMEQVTSVKVRHLEEQTSTKAGIRNKSFEEGKQIFEKKWKIPFLKAYEDLSASVSVC